MTIDTADTASPSHLSMRAFNPNALFAPRDFVALAPSVFNTPLVLEIGAGKGKHALSFAEQNPQLTLLAIERTSDKFNVMQQRAQALKLANLHCIHADAIVWSVFALPPQCLDAIYILYPNPEPKNAAQRWLNMPYFSFLLSRLKAGGTLTLASNITSYIQEASTLLTTQWKLPFTLLDVSSLPEIVAQPRTHFELKYLARGETCQQIVLQKPADYRTAFDSYNHKQEPNPLTLTEQDC